MTATLQNAEGHQPRLPPVQGFGASVGYVLDFEGEARVEHPDAARDTCGVTPLVTSTLVGTPAERNFKVQVR